MEKFGSLKNYLREEDIPLSTFQGWFTRFSRCPEVETLLKISRDADIGREKAYDSLNYFYTGHRENKILLPRKIEFNKKFIEGLGLYVGEGQRKSNEVALSNTTPEILNFFIEWLENSFGVERGRLRWHIYIPERNLDRRKVKEDWCNKISLTEDQLVNINYYKNSKKVCVLIIYGNKIIHHLINQLISELRKDIKENEEFIFPYLKGLFAAEGHVRIKGKNIHHLELGMKKKSEVQFASELLKKANINSHIKKNNGCYVLSVNRKENIERLVREDLFDLHPGRNKKLKLALDNFVQSQIGRNKLFEHYSRYFLNHNELTVKELVELAGKSESQCRRVINKFMKKGILKRIKRENKYVYKLNQNKAEGVLKYENK